MRYMNKKPQQMNSNLLNSQHSFAIHYIQYTQRIPVCTTSNIVVCASIPFVILFL